RPREVTQIGQTSSSPPPSAYCSNSRSIGGQPSHATPCALPGTARWTASLVRNIATCLPFCVAACPTRNAIITRSPSSRPVARLISTFSLSAMLLAPLGCSDRRSHRAELGGLPPRVFEHRVRVGVNQFALGDVGVGPLDQQARVLAMEQRPGNSAGPQIDP